jgi:transcriptional regulator with XRE-family HTH domain
MAQVPSHTQRRDPHAPPYVILREHLVAARKAAGVSQQVVADRIGRQQSFVAKVESGERSLDVIEFVAIARALGLHAHEVLAAVELEI